MINKTLLLFTTLIIGLLLYSGCKNLYCKCCLIECAGNETLVVQYVAKSNGDDLFQLGVWDVTKVKIRQFNTADTTTLAYFRVENQPTGTYLFLETSSSLTDFEIQLDSLNIDTLKIVHHTFISTEECCAGSIEVIDFARFGLDTLRSSAPFGALQIKK